MAYIKTVTQGNWGVSVTTGGNIMGAVLHVYQWVKRGANGEIMPDSKMRRGDAYGKVFDTTEQAYAFALEHGYLQEFRRGVCPHCREYHYFLGTKSSFCDVTNKYF